MAVDDADGAAIAVVDVGNATVAGGATGVPLASTVATDLAGMSGGSVVTRLGDSVIVSSGLSVVWHTGVTLGTG